MLKIKYACHYYSQLRRKSMIPYNHEFKLFDDENLIRFEKTVENRKSLIKFYADYNDWFVYQ